MAAEFTLAIVAPDREVLDAQVTSCVAPGEAGYLGVLVGHEATVVSLKPGLVEYTEPAGGTHFVAIAGGFAEITPTRMTILADAAERSKEIDASRAEESLEEARRALRGESSTMSQEQAVKAAEWAMTRIKAARS